MDINKFLLKPVEIEMFGEKVPIKPLSTKFYPLLIKSQRIEADILNKVKNKEEITDSDFEDKANIDQEIAFKVMSDIFPELTRKQFDDDLPFEIIREIMSAVLKASGITDEKLEEASEKLKSIMEKQDAVKNTAEDKQE
jgi:hypothetical protein